MKCSTIVDRYNSEITEIVNAQVEENREAIFFFYEDGSTSDIYKGEATQISLSREEEARIMSQGRVIGSVHSHPSGFDPSTIDIMTGVMTQQESMCVAVPIHNSDIEEDFVLTCLDLSNLSMMERRRMVGAMRRSSVGVTEMGREVRKQTALQRFKVEGCRTHEVEVDGVQFPASDRPSALSLEIGQETGVKKTPTDEEYID